MTFDVLILCHMIGVMVGVTVIVLVGVAVDVWVMVGVEVTVLVLVAVGVAVRVLVGVLDGEAVGVMVGVYVGVGVAVSATEIEAATMQMLIAINRSHKFFNIFNMHPQAGISLRQSPLYHKWRGVVKLKCHGRNGHCHCEPENGALVLVIICARTGRGQRQKHHENRKYFFVQHVTFSPGSLDSPAPLAPRTQ